MKEKSSMHEKSEFPDRIIKQMELPIDLAGSSIEHPKDVMNPALMGGISLAFQGFETFLPSDDKVHEINWDECQIPTFKRVKKAYETELNKSESLRDLVATAAVDTGLVSTKIRYTILSTRCIIFSLSCSSVNSAPSSSASPLASLPELNNSLGMDILT